MDQIITTLAHPVEARAAIDARIKDILARGKTVCFTNAANGIVKHVTEWNMDADGDLKASFSTGAVKYVCPYAIVYNITEI